MAKPLSQNEIDALLDVREAMDEDVDSGKSRESRLEEISSIESMLSEPNEENVQPYNFKRPRLFSQDQMRVLNRVHEAFARDLSVYLSAQLRTIVDISLQSVDQVLYSEFVMSSASPSALYVMEERSLDHNIVVEMDPCLVIYTIEKLCGGPGTFLEEAREVSQIEQRIMGKVMERAYDELEKAWNQAHEIELHEEAFESNAEFVQIIPAVEPALVATFEVKVYDENSFINICYPYLLLEKMLGRAGMKQWISQSTTSAPPEERARYEDTIRDMEVELNAELGRTRLSASEVLQLKEGDALVLDREVDAPVKVYVDRQEKFKATAGRSGKNRALRILEVIQSQQTLVDHVRTNDAQDHDERNHAPGEAGATTVSEDAAGA